MMIIPMINIVEAVNCVITNVDLSFDDALSETDWFDFNVLLGKKEERIKSHHKI